MPPSSSPAIYIWNNIIWTIPDLRLPGVESNCHTFFYFLLGLKRKFCWEHWSRSVVGWNVEGWRESDFWGGFSPISLISLFDSLQTKLLENQGSNGKEKWLRGEEEVRKIEGPQRKLLENHGGKGNEKRLWEKEEAWKIDGAQIRTEGNVSKEGDMFLRWLYRGT